MSQFFIFMHSWNKNSFLNTFALRRCLILFSSYECQSKIHGAIPFVTQFVSSVFGYSVLSDGIVSVDGCVGALLCFLI